jgi:hypothetical protein
MQKRAATVTAGGIRAQIVLTTSEGNRFGRSQLFSRTLGRQTEHKDLSVPRLPVMKVDPAKSSDPLVLDFTPRVHHVKKRLRFGLSEKRCVKKLCYPIHLVRVGQAKRDLNVLIRILHYHDAVIVNVAVLPFSFEENGAAFLDFGHGQTGGFEVSDDIRVGQRLDCRAAARSFWLRRTERE